MTHDDTRRMVERMPEPFRSAGLARIDEHDWREQDELNGAALRQLDKALPEGSVAAVYVHARGGTSQIAYYSDTTHDVADWVLTGPTIAHTADAVREKLTRK